MASPISDPASPACAPTSALFASRGQQVSVSAPGAVAYSATHITARVAHASTSVRERPGGGVEAAPVSREYAFSTRRRVARTGVMVVGLGGNNGTTLAAGLLAHKLGLEWRTRAGAQRAAWVGSLTQASTVRLGQTAEGRDVFVPFASLLPMLAPEEIVVGGWDISSVSLCEAVDRAHVLDIDLQRQLAPHLRAAYGTEPPLPSIYYPSFIAKNQAARADNLLFGGGGSKSEHVAAIRGQIRAFKARHALETVIVLWSANTERFCEVRTGLNDSAEALLAAIARNEPEVSPSTVFAVAAVAEGCSYLNASPQNTLVPGLVELATRARPRVFIGGDDLKT
jgi:myo-inositol-1-phosphate synthase